MGSTCQLSSCGILQPSFSASFVVGLKEANVVFRASGAGEALLHFTRTSNSSGTLSTPRQAPLRAPMVLGGTAELQQEGRTDSLRFCGGDCSPGPG